MSDPLDDLRAALGSIEPSPAFERQTLARIERERAITARRAWMLLAPVAAAAIVIAAISSRPSAVVNPVAPAGVDAAAQAAAPAPIVAPGLHPAPVTRIARRSPRRAEAARPVSRSLAIPEDAHVDQVIALRRLMLSAKSGLVVGMPDANDLNDDGSIRMPALIEIKPIVIAPVQIARGDGSER